jgi:hypothetical protein
MLHCTKHNRKRCFILVLRGRVGHASARSILPREPSSAGLLVARLAAELRPGADPIQVGAANGFEEIDAGPGPGVTAPVANQFGEAVSTLLDHGADNHRDGIATNPRGLR